MNWLDILLTLGLAALTAFAAKRKLTGLVVSLGGVLFLRPLLLLSQLNLFMGLVVALLLSAVLGLAGRVLSRRVRVKAPYGGLLGGGAGFVLALLLVLSLSVSLPIERDVNNRLIYPSTDMRGIPTAISRAFRQSLYVGLGRDILFFPLFDAAGQVEPTSREMMRGLHWLLVAGRPWERGL